eukprot:3281815-Prymnesium_polylepis.1
MPGVRRSSRGDCPSLWAAKICAQPPTRGRPTPRGRVSHVDERYVSLIWRTSSQLFLSVTVTAATARGVRARARTWRGPSRRARSRCRFCSSRWRIA